MDFFYTKNRFISSLDVDLIFLKHSRFRNKKKVMSIDLVVMFDASSRSLFHERGSLLKKEKKKIFIFILHKKQI